MTFKKYINHYQENFRLAVPVVIAHIGQMLTNIADNVMTGHYSTLSLSASAFMNSVFIIVMVFGIGFAQGLTPLIGKAIGQKELQRTGHLLRHSLLLNTAVVAILLLILNNTTPLLFHMGQVDEVVREGIPYYKVINWSLLPMIVFFSFKQFAEGNASTKPAMIITLGANVLNVIINYILIFGKWGAPEMGLIGAGIATLIARVTMAIAMAAYILYTPRFKEHLKGFYERSISSTLLWDLIKVSFPIALQVVMEVAAFAIGGIMVGQLGKNEIAAHQIAISLSSVTFMMANGLSAAITIRNSGAHGQNNYTEARDISWAGLHMVIIFMLFSSVVFILGSEWMASLYTPDLTVVKMAIPMIGIAALFQLFDGIQVLSFGALRGISDVKNPTIIAFIAYWLVSLPTGYLLAFHSPLRELGVWVGFLAGLSTASVLLTLRFHKITRKMQQLYTV
ncbi:MATE family efflux transporter [Algivirga pacifica]|uniref:Multidrug-efflux transporter n=1 Tax=Algivirga pacifica TaxID=1162670 RepID=A0ABP9DLX0_9BACT